MATSAELLKNIDDLIFCFAKNYTHLKRRRAEFRLRIAAKGNV